MRGDVIGRNGRSAGVVTEIGIFLHFEHRFRESAVGLVERNNPRAFLKVPSVGVERRARPMDLDLTRVQDVEQSQRRVRITLLFRNDEGKRRLVVLHPVTMDAVEVLEPRRAIFREMGEAAENGRDAVIHDL